MLLRTACLVSLMTIPAQAQQAPQCKPLPIMLLELSAKFGETPIMKGVVDGGQSYVTMTANPQKDTFTILIVNPQAIACIASSGSGLEWDNYKPPGYPT